MKEYRVWFKKKGVDQRGTQGHYVLANNEMEAVKSVMRKGERVSDFDALLWKVDMKRTPQALCFIDTGDAERCRKLGRRK